MKQQHRKAIVAALAAAGLLSANISYAGNLADQQSEYELSANTGNTERGRATQLGQDDEEDSYQDEFDEDEE